MRRDDHSPIDIEPEPDDGQLLTKQDVAKLLKLSDWTVSRMVKAGKLPAPIKLSDCTLRWSAYAIRRWQLALQREAEEGRSEESRERTPAQRAHIAALNASRWKPRSKRERIRA